MHSSNLSLHTTILGEILTPSDQRVGQKAVRISAFSFAELISKNIVKNNNLPQDTHEKLGYLIATKNFNNSFCTGIPKRIYNNIQIEQVVFSSSSVIQYYKEIDTLFSFWSLYATNFLNVITEIIQGTKSLDLFSQTTDEFLKLLNTIQCFSKIIQLDIKSLPGEFGINDVDQQIASFLSKAIQFLQEGDKLRAMKMSKMNTDQQDASFIKELQELNNSVSEFHQIFANYQKQIKDQFNPLYNEQAFNDWQQYCSNFSDAISTIVFLSYLISESDPTQFLTVIQLLQEMVNHTFSIISPYLCALRFRGNFKECQLKSKESHEKISILFNKVFDIISGIIDKCPAQLVEYFKEKISTIFGSIRNIHSDYNQNVENLINAMKSDPRFSVFSDSEPAEKNS